MNSDADEAPEKPIRPEADKVLLPNVSAESSGSKRGATDSRGEERDSRVNEGAGSQGHAMSREEGQRTKRVRVDRET